MLSASQSQIQRGLIECCTRERVLCVQSAKRVRCEQHYIYNHVKPRLVECLMFLVPSLGLQSVAGCDEVALRGNVSLLIPRRGGTRVHAKLEGVSKQMLPIS